jgi:hypothetical protein
LDLDDLPLLQCGSGFLGVGLERSVGRNVRAGRNSRAVSDALQDLLALVDLANFLR